MGLVVPWHVGSSWTRDQTRVSCIGKQSLYHWATREAPQQVIFHHVLSFSGFMNSRLIGALGKLFLVASSGLRSRGFVVWLGQTPCRHFLFRFHQLSSGLEGPSSLKLGVLGVQICMRQAYANFSGALFLLSSTLAVLRAKAAFSVVSWDRE